MPVMCHSDRKSKRGSFTLPRLAEEHRGKTYHEAMTDILEADSNRNEQPTTNSPPTHSAQKQRKKPFKRPQYQQSQRFRYMNDEQIF